MRLLIVGPGCGGKDTLAEFWKQEFGLTYTSSSLAAAKLFLYDALSEKYGYENFEQCYADRRNRREEWKRAISAYNTPDKARLAYAILQEHDCYVGMRCSEEITACREDNLFDLIIYVDPGDRVPMEGSESFDITPRDADVILMNDRTLEEFRDKALRFGKQLFTKPYVNAYD